MHSVVDELEREKEEKQREKEETKERKNNKERAIQFMNGDARKALLHFDLFEDLLTINKQEEEEEEKRERKNMFSLFSNSPSIAVHSLYPKRGAIGYERKKERKKERIDCYQ